MPTTITVGDLVIEPRQRRVLLRGKQLQLTRREFDVLTYLAERVGQVVSRRELLSEVWNQTRIGEELGREVPLLTLIEHPTIASFSAWLEGLEGESEMPLAPEASRERVSRQRQALELQRQRSMRRPTNR